jgi:hypothetical protein
MALDVNQKEWHLSNFLTAMGDDLMVVNAARVSFAKESHEFSARR